MFPLNHPLNHVHSRLVETEHFIHYKESNFVHLSYTLVFILLGKKRAFSLAEYIMNLMDVNNIMFPFRPVLYCVVKTNHLIHYKGSNYMHLSYTLVFIFCSRISSLIANIH